jgi:hypothetical protein
LAVLGAAIAAFVAGMGSVDKSRKYQKRHQKNDVNVGDANSSHIGLLDSHGNKLMLTLHDYFIYFFNNN